MPHDAESGRASSEDHLNGGDVAAANPPDDGTPMLEKQLRLLFTVPILLGLFICALNILVIVRLWRAVYFSNIGLLSRANLPNTVCFALLAISFAIGLALIVYAIALRHYDEWYDLHSEAVRDAPPEPESPTATVPKRIPTYLKWFVVPLLLAAPAPALTVWAASTVEPLTPVPCIELYQRALELKRDNPQFKMVWNDRDQLRCSINQVLDQ